MAVAAPPDIWYYDFMNCEGAKENTMEANVQNANRLTHIVDEYLETSFNAGKRMRFPSMMKYMREKYGIVLQWNTWEMEVVRERWEECR